MRLLPAFPPSRAGQVVAATCVLGLLYVGRDFLAPVALAAVLSLVMAPLKRRLARLGLGHEGGALVSVLLVAAAIAFVAAVLVSQLVAVASDMPQYKEAARSKLEQVRDITIRPLEQIESELSGIVPRPSGAAAGKAGARRPPADPRPQAVQGAEARPTATDTATRILSSLWGPVGQAGLVLVLLVFILLEHEGLRDRMIRLAGDAEAGRTMQVVEDAAQGISHFFFAQCVVNATFGLALAIALWTVGVPHAALWGVVGGLARFVPYVGALAAGVVIAAFSAAVDPGWSLMLWSVSLFLVMEVLVAHVVEPRVYGHSSGLAPLGVIVSALFWGALWGPVGLLLSTPMTLCLVVAGRHVRALAPISILFGERPGLAAGLRLYQRALSGEATEIVAAAQAYLRRSNFARYCDQILLPGLALAAADVRAGRIGNDQQDRIRRTITTVAQSLSASRPQEGASRRRRSTSLLEANVGGHLHALREQRAGAGRRAADGQPVVLCAVFGTVREDLLSQLLVQSLRDEGVDSRALALGGPAESPQPWAPDAVSTVLVAHPLEDDLAAWQEAARSLRALYPRAMLLAVRLTLEENSARDAAVARQVDLVVHSFSEAVAFALAGDRPVAARAGAFPRGPYSSGQTS